MLNRLRHRRTLAMLVIIPLGAVVFGACNLISAPYGGVESMVPQGNQADVEGYILPAYFKALFVNGLANCNLNMQCLDNDLYAVISYGDPSQVHGLVGQAIADCADGICGDQNQLYAVIVDDAWVYGGAKGGTFAIRPEPGGQAFDYYGNLPPLWPGNSQQGGWGLCWPIPGGCY